MCLCIRQNTEPSYHSAAVLRALMVFFVVVFAFRDILKLISQVPYRTLLAVDSNVYVNLYIASS